MRGTFLISLILVLILGCDEEKPDGVCSVDISELRVQDATRLNGILRVTNNTTEKISLAKFVFTDLTNFHIVDGSGRKIFTDLHSALFNPPPRQVEDDFFELAAGRYREFEFTVLYSRNLGDSVHVFHIGSTPGSELTLQFEAEHDMEGCSVHSPKDQYVRAARELLPRLIPTQVLKSTGVSLSLLD